MACFSITSLLPQTKQPNSVSTQKLNQRQRKTVRHAQGSQWLAENMSALVEYNRRIELRGTFSENHGGFNPTQLHRSFVVSLSNHSFYPCRIMAASV